jgi:flagellar biosynthetic protein FliR
MIQVEIVNIELFMAYWMIFSRTLPILMQLPIFDNVSIPFTVKVLMSMLISFAFYPGVSAEVLKDITHAGATSFWTLTIFHTVMGLMIGYIIRSIMNIFISAGNMITQQIGFGAISYFDPTFEERVGPFEQLIQWAILVIVISSGALLPMFKGIFQSFYHIHIYDLGKLFHNPLLFLDFFKSIFTSSLLLSTPIIFTNVLIMAVLGIVSRFVPQMNILMVSFVLNIGLGLLVFISCSNEFFSVAFKIYTEKLGDWFNLIS